MVLGANGFESTANTIDEHTLIQKMYEFMKASGSWEPATTLEQAYPFLKNLLTADSARRQRLDNIDPDEPSDAT